MLAHDFDNLLFFVIYSLFCSQQWLHPQSLNWHSRLAAVPLPKESKASLWDTLPISAHKKPYIKRAEARLSDHVSALLLCSHLLNAEIYDITDCATIICATWAISSRYIWYSDFLCSSIHLYCIYGQNQSVLLPFLVKNSQNRHQIWYYDLKVPNAIALFCFLSYYQFVSKRAK